MATGVPFCLCHRAEAEQIVHWLRQCNSADWKMPLDRHPSDISVQGRCQYRHNRLHRTDDPWSEPAPLQKNMFRILIPRSCPLEGSISSTDHTQHKLQHTAQCCSLLNATSHIHHLPTVQLASYYSFIRHKTCWFTDKSFHCTGTDNWSMTKRKQRKNSIK